MGKKFNTIIMYLFVVGVGILFIEGCSKNEHPSKSDIHLAVTKYLQHEVPISWTGNLLGGKKAQVKLIKVVKRGLYNKQQKYWPFKIHVQGICRLNDPFNQSKQVSFDKIGDFILYRDDYGDWQAMLKRGMFQ